MSKTPHWSDTTQYVLIDFGNGYSVVSLPTGGIVVLDYPEPEADAAIRELLDAGRPVLTTPEEVAEARRASRGKPKYELAGGPDLKLWRDEWGNILLRAVGFGDEAVQLSTHEARALGEALIALAD